MGIRRRLIVGGVAAVMGLGTMAGPAVAHPRKITYVHGSMWSAQQVLVEAYLDHAHGGTMKIVLKKKSGDTWVPLDSKTATLEDGRYEAMFAAPSGNQTCKAVATHKAPDHPTISRGSSPFNC